MNDGIDWKDQHWICIREGKLQDNPALVDQPTSYFKNFPNGLIYYDGDSQDTGTFVPNLNWNKEKMQFELSPIQMGVDNDALASFTANIEIRFNEFCNNVENQLNELTKGK